MEKIDVYYQAFMSHMADKIKLGEPESLYAPIHYILELGGKRLRPILTLMAADAFGAKPQEALDAALSVEVFHNFSLVHDDIMDRAPLRRGQPTVHEKWDLNTGILSGDAMLILAYQLFETYPPEIFCALAKLFSKTALQVCEGQQHDMDFEVREDVTVEEYLKMIKYKTAVLVGAAMKMGAIVARANAKDQDHLYEFGTRLGIAFQLQDDYLDAFGDPLTFGKQVGGDIIENKKTYLYLKAVEYSSEEDRLQLQHLFSINPTDAADKIETVKHLFLSSGAAEATRSEIQHYTNSAFEVLEELSIAEAQKMVLKSFGEQLMNRKV